VSEKEKIQRISYMVTTILIAVEEKDNNALDSFMWTLTERDIKLLKHFGTMLIELHDGLKPHFDKYNAKQEDVI